MAATVARERGGVRGLAAGRAVVTADVLVTGEAIRVAARDGSARFVRAGTVQVLTGRGRTVATSAPVLLVGGEVLLAPRWHETVRVRGRLGPMEPADDRVATLAVSGRPVSLAPPGAVARGAERLRTGLRHAVDDAPADARGPAARPRHRRHEPHPAGPHRGDAGHRDDAPDRRLRQQRRRRHRARPRPVRRRRRPTAPAAGARGAGPRGVRRPRPPGAERRARGRDGRDRAARAQPVAALGRAAGARRRGRRRPRPRPVARALVRLRPLDPRDARAAPLHPPWGEAVGRRLPRRLAPLGPALAVPSPRR